MAIVQISQITQRKGLQADLPQLAGAEFGWSTDERRLFIGNGTLADGAPVIGNTEILTEFSDILEFTTTYTYKGLAAGYQVQTGPTPSTPVTQSLQSWLDQWASVTDFGAVGDGLTDDTDAINRALYQLYCREANPQIRRALFFPAGVYRITNSIIIPPYATLYGEGADASIIQLQSGADSALTEYVARTGDSLQQTGSDIGTNDATTPQYVTISNMGFEALDPDALGVFFFEDTVNSSVNNCTFMGPYSTTFITDEVSPDPSVYPLAGVIVESTNGTATNITLDRCVYSGCTYGVYNVLSAIDTLNMTNSNFDTLYSGVSVVEGTSQGIRVLHNRFDNIYAQGVYFASANSGTGYNFFLDVGNHFLGAGNPFEPNIEWAGTGISLADTFTRDSTDAADVLSIQSGTGVIAMANGDQLAMGNYIRQSGLSETLINNEVSFTTAFTTIIPYNRITIDYSITRNGVYRNGVISAAVTGSTIVWSDDYNQTGDTGVVLNLTSSGSLVTVQYTTTNTSYNATLNYSITTI